VRLFSFISLLALASGVASAQAPQVAAQLGRQILDAGLDPAECYWVRDLEISQEEARFYLTDGYLMLGRPVNGQPLTAVFSADTDGGDAVVLLLPSGRAERKSMAAYTDSPTLNEHFTQAAFVFTDETAQSLREQLVASDAKKVPDIGAVMQGRWGSVISNLMSSFETRLVLDLLTTNRKGGFFEALLQGRKLGNFDVIHDDRATEQLIVGQLTERNGSSWWDTWTSFVTRSHQGQQQPPPEQETLSYRIDATLDPALSLHCVTKIRIRAEEGSSRVIALDLSGRMRALSAKVDGVEAEIFERDSIRTGLVRGNGNELLLILPRETLAPGSEHEVEITHEGQVVTDAGHHVYFVGSRGSWYPGRGIQYADFDVTYHYPKALDLIAAGNVTEDRTEGDTRITRRVTGRIRFLGFNLGEYENRDAERNGITVSVHANRDVEDALRPKVIETTTVPVIPAPRGWPQGRGGMPRVPQPEEMTMIVTPPAPNPTNSLSRIAGTVESAMEFYRARFGEPPLKHIEVSPVPGRFGQGYPGMLYLPTTSYLDPPSSVDAARAKEMSYFSELLIAHEAAHQWWGNVVTTDSYHNEWLMESLANYSALMYAESRQGPKALEPALDQYRQNMFLRGPDGETAESEGPVVQGRRLESSNNPSAWQSVVYGKGTWIIHMIRRRLGDENFQKMLLALRQRFDGKPLDTESFRLLCAEFSPPGTPDAKFENFFDQWVYGTGVPTLKMTFSVKGKPGAYKLTGTVTQSDIDEDTSIAVPVEIQTGKGKPLVQMVRTSSEPVQFSVNVPAATAKAVLDPGWSILRR
jgi:hypothetical protein